MDLDAKMVKVLIQLVRDMGLNATQFQFSQLINCTDVEEYIYISTYC